MYPYNKHCQFEISISSKGRYNGGFLYFEPSLVPTYPTVENYQEINKNNIISVYQLIFIFILIILILYKIISL